MITVKSQFIQYMLTAVTLFLVVGVLSMIWPMILAIFLGVFLSTRIGLAVIFP